MLRRARVRIDYGLLFSGQSRGIQFVFQFDAKLKGVLPSGMFWGGIFENRFKLFSCTTGALTAVGKYEVDPERFRSRVFPERGRIGARYLMKSERDTGAMAGFDVRRKDHPLKHLKN